MTLGEVVRRLPEASLRGDATLEVTGISHDSRRVQQGWIFAALPGQRAHGIDYLDEALGRGAAAVLSDLQPPQQLETDWITTPSPRPAMAEAAMALAGDPQRELLMVGITGTNGKSTTAHLLSLILNAADRPASFLGTLGSHLPNGEVLAGDRTTPESTDLAPLLRRIVELGGRAVAMEVSSHALVQDRVAGIQFQIAVWTNLTRDHLDYHRDMEDYYQAKRLLFDRHLAPDGRRVLPLDDDWTRRLLDEPRVGDVSWGLKSGEVHARQLSPSLEGSSFELCLPDTTCVLRLPLIGLHNVRNALAAAAAAHAAGVDGETIGRALSEAQPLSGRLERVAEQLVFPVLVDFAHTPDGLKTVMESLREISDRRLIVVFGAGGDKDRGKRGPMGHAVGSHADVAVVTSDNPRTEDPSVIAEAVADGVRAAGREPLVVLDRREAVAQALEMADENSLVVVAGKGHEAVQTIGETDTPFSDQQVILELAGGTP